MEKYTAEKAIALMPELLKICLDKGFNFDLNASCKNISVYKFDDCQNYIFRAYGYFSESLFDNSDDGCFTIQEILTKIKSL